METPFVSYLLKFLINLEMKSVGFRLKFSSSFFPAFFIDRLFSTGDLKALTDQRDE